MAWKVCHCLPSTRLWGLEGTQGHGGPSYVFQSFLPSQASQEEGKAHCLPILLRAPSALIPPSLESQRPHCLAYEKLKINLFTALPFILLTLLPVALHLSHIHSVPVFYPCLFLQPGPPVGSLLSLPGLQTCLPSRDIGSCVGEISLF